MDFEDEQEKPGKQVAPGGPAPVTLFLALVFLVAIGLLTWWFLKAL